MLQATIALPHVLPEVRYGNPGGHEGTEQGSGVDPVIGRPGGELRSRACPPGPPHVRHAADASGQALGLFEVPVHPGPAARAQVVQDRSGGAVRHHPAVVDDAVAGAHLGQLRQDVARQDDRLSHFSQRPDQLADLAPGPRVKTGRRFIEEQDLGVVYERSGQAEPLFHAAGQGVDLGVSLGAQVDQFQEVGDDPVHDVLWEPVARRIKGQVLGRRHGVIDAEEVGHVPDQLVQPVALPRHVHAIDLGPAPARPGQARQDAQSRRLPGPIGADEPEYLSFGHLETEYP